MYFIRRPSTRASLALFKSLMVEIVMAEVVVKLAAIFSKKCEHITSVENEEAIAQPCEDRFHSWPQIDDAKRAPRRRPQTHEPPTIPAVHIPQVAQNGENERFQSNHETTSYAVRSQATPLKCIRPWLSTRLCQLPVTDAPTYFDTHH